MTSANENAKRLVSAVHSGDVRIERKFASGSCDPQALVSQLRASPYSFLEEHPERSVHSLYFDGDELESFHSHINEDSIREKVRLRWYGPPGANAKVALAMCASSNLEIKWRKGPIMGKPIWPVSSKAVRRLLTNSTDWLGYTEFPAEIHEQLKRLKMQCLVSFDRRYFVACESNVRLTLDYNLRCTSINSLATQYRGWSLGEEVTVELKFPPEEKNQAQAISDLFPWIPINSSKYVRAVNSLR